jgi:hypothetical protein
MNTVRVQAVLVFLVSLYLVNTYESGLLMLLGWVLGGMAFLAFYGASKD